MPQDTASGDPNSRELTSSSLLLWFPPLLITPSFHHNNRHYWFQNDDNNSDAPDFDPPTYNEKYGMRDGAQLDLRYDASGEVPVWQGWTNLGCWARQPGDSTGMEHQMKDDWTTNPGTCIAKCGEQLAE